MRSRGMLASLGLMSTMAIATVALVNAITIAPAFAQTAQQTMEDYINAHPELQQNPSLINDPRYQATHPGLRHFLDAHPNVDRARYGRMGAYDQNHQWRNSDWWHQNDPNWVNQHHPDWDQENPQWAHDADHHGDGDYDDRHRWRAREWWDKHHPGWVKKHHPEWVEEHENQSYDHHGPNQPYGNGNPPPHSPYGNGKYPE